MVKTDKHYDTVILFQGSVYKNDGLNLDNSAAAETVHFDWNNQQPYKKKLPMVSIKNNKRKLGKYWLLQVMVVKMRLKCPTMSQTAYKINLQTIPPELDSKGFHLQISISINNVSKRSIKG